jgi:hypothetical protein
MDDGRCPVVAEVRKAVAGGLPAVHQLMERWRRDLADAEPPAVLEEVRDLRLWEGQRTGFIYFLCRGEELLYVGRTVGPLKYRLQQHQNTRGWSIPFNRVWFLEVSVDYINDEEARWISELAPPFNRRGYSA